MQDDLNVIIEQARYLIGSGQVAQYIPALANVSPDYLGIAIYTVGGDLYCAGDAHQNFSIQSISKVFSLAQAVSIDDTLMWTRIGQEPSGCAFNSMVQLELEHGRPRNPFINAGALVVCDILHSQYATPSLSMRDFVRQLSGNASIFSDQLVSESEYQFRSRNAAMAYLMQSLGNFENDVDAVLRTYFHQCALTMSCVDISKAFGFLANQGKSPLDGRTVLSPLQSKQINALLATCGLYDEAGSFAYRVGLPAKSGVGGGILAIAPGRFSACVWSPELNQAGNSLAGIKALEILSETFNCSVF